MEEAIAQEVEKNGMAENFLNWLPWIAFTVAILVLLWIVLEYKKPPGKRVVRRFNVLFLMTWAYVTVFAIFLTLVLATRKTADESWEIVQAAVMALIGGTLAISKDLIQDDEKDNDNPGKKKHPQDPPTTSTPTNTPPE